MVEKTKLGTAFLHSTYIRANKDRNMDAVCVSELNYYDDGSTVPTLRLIKNPSRSIYITKPKFRNHSSKKEREQIEKLDRITTPNKDLNKAVFKALNGYAPKGYVDNSILDSPYVYGGSASIEYLIKRKYVNDFEKTKLPVKNITIGGLDTEFSLLEDSLNELICVTVTHENKVYTAINIKFFTKYNDDKTKFSSGDINELSKLSNEILTPLINEMFEENKSLSSYKNKLPFTFDYYVGVDELSCIKWVFEQIHKNRTSFMNIWNMDYDISMILKVLDKYNIDPKDIFCSPDLPEEWKSFYYKKDKKVASHITDIWNWVNCTSYTQYYDSMPAYAKLRTVYGKESTYALDYILKINNLEGKLKFDIKDHPEIRPGSTDWHRYMSKYESYLYIIYNQADSIWLQLLMWVTKDTENFYALSGLTPLSKAFKQTIRTHDDFYNTWIDQGYVMGTSSSNVEYHDDDDDTEKKKAEGGAVLSPNLLNPELGMCVLKQAPDQHTSMLSFVNDVDFSQMYPRTVITGNISKETKMCTVTNIGGNPDVEEFFSMYTNLKDNSVKIGTHFLKLPSFMEMEELFKSKLK